MAAEDMDAGRRVTVWSSTWVPARSPIAGFGADGYSVAWVDGPAGREQVLVAGEAPPVGSAGRVVSQSFGDVDVELLLVDQS